MTTGRVELEAQGPFSLERSVAFAGAFRPPGRRRPGRTVLRALSAADVAAHAARILSLDVDATAYPAVGQRDPVVGRLQERHAGLRPVLFGTPSRPRCGRC